MYSMIMASSVQKRSVMISFGQGKSVAPVTVAHLVFLVPINYK